MKKSITLRHFVVWDKDSNGELIMTKLKNGKTKAVIKDRLFEVLVAENSIGTSATVDNAICPGSILNLDSVAEMCSDENIDVIVVGKQTADSPAGARKF